MDFTRTGPNATLTNRLVTPHYGLDGLLVLPPFGAPGHAEHIYIRAPRYDRQSPTMEPGKTHGMTAKGLLAGA